MTQARQWLRQESCYCHMSFIRIVREENGDIDGRLYSGAQGATMGRSPLLPPQPNQSGAALGQRIELRLCLRARLPRPGRGRFGGLARRDDQPASRALLLRAEGL